MAEKGLEEGGGRGRDALLRLSVEGNAILIYWQVERGVPWGSHSLELLLILCGCMRSSERPLPWSHITGHLWTLLLPSLCFVLSASTASVQLQEYPFSAFLFLSCTFLLPSQSSPSTAPQSSWGQEQQTYPSFCTPPPLCINYASTVISNVLSFRLRSKL